MFNMGIAYHVHGYDIVISKWKPFLCHLAWLLRPMQQYFGPAIRGNVALSCPPMSTCILCETSPSLLSTLQQPLPHLLVLDIFFVKEPGEVGEALVDNLMMRRRTRSCFRPRPQL